MEKIIFTCEKMFVGNNIGDESDTKEKSYRFKIVANEKGKIIVIPEVFLDEKEAWSKACPGWVLQDVLGSQGLFLDFGQKKYIKPTEEVWDEIEIKLASTNDC